MSLRSSKLDCCRKPQLELLLPVGLRHDISLEICQRLQRLCVYEDIQASLNLEEEDRGNVSKLFCVELLGTYSQFHGRLRRAVQK